MLTLGKRVGIEVAGKHLHFAAVKRGVNGYAVTHVMTVENFADSDPLALRPSVEDFYRRSGVDRTRTVVALPRSSVVLRTLQFPKEVRVNLDNILEYQVENFEPTDRSELVYAYQLLDRGEASGKLEVLLAMARRAEVERLKDFFATLGIRPLGLVCATFGLVQLMQLEKALGARENNFLLRLGEKDFELMALLAGRSKWAQRLDFRAEESRGEQIQQAIERACGELRLEKKNLHNVFALGADREKEVALLRQQSPALPVRWLRKPAPLRSTLNPAEFQLMAPAIGTALAAMNPKQGLATNLLAKGETLSPPRWIWAPTAALSGVALLMAGAGWARPYLQQSRFLNQLNAEIQRVQPQVRQVERIETEAETLQKKAAVLARAEYRDALNLEALRELSEIVPETAWMSEFSMRGETVEIGGLADNATALVPLLEQSPLFQDVALASGITKDPQGKELFRIRAKFEF